MWVMLIPFHEISHANDFSFSPSFPSFPSFPSLSKCINFKVKRYEAIPTVVNSSKHLFLLDSGVGREVAIAHIQAWRSQQPSPYIIVLELKNDSNLIS
ncbi:hypothetical protein NIES4103_28170 [Nostoc sp. NIES-4103]|nr:hypothetical protein NIES4103_28170 [Nostoc sp. NIES-4103]